MENDAGWFIFLSDDRRYADFVNGCACNGKQPVTADHIREMDTRSSLKIVLQGKRKYLGKIRDIVRKVIFGVNFVIIGVESQENKDYAYPVRNMIYDAGAYEKQLRKIRKLVHQTKTGLSAGEYLYGFRKADRLRPVVTFLLYAGEEPWGKPADLWDMLDFTDVPEELREKVQNYRINIVDIRRMQDTSVFQTDIREVFEFIRCSKNKDKLKELVEHEEYFRHMEEDAFDVAVNYSNAAELEFAKEEHKAGGKINMCVAIQEMMADSKAEGFELGVSQGISQGELRGKVKIYAYEMNLSTDEIAAKLDVTPETVVQILHNSEKVSH
jgi:hypothetical protein